jgi:site-specific DNA recombinase
MSIEQMRERMPALRQRDQALRAELQAIADQANDRAAFLDRLRGAADTLSITERQRIVRLVVKDVLIGVDNITIRHGIPVLQGPPQRRLPTAKPDRRPKLPFCKGSDHRTLRSTHLRVLPFAFLHHSGFQPFLDQPENPAVGNAMLDEL